MAHRKRIIAPGSLVHVMTRFVNKERRIQDSDERAEYLRLLGNACAKTDWTVFSYCLMSSHVHLGCIAGMQPLDALARRIHPPFATWLNKRQGRLGHAFADRPSTPTLSAQYLPRLTAYLHNNPVRAGVCSQAEESWWSSHPYYLQPRGRPPWLRVDIGLQFCGFTDNAEGRAAFNDFVHEQADTPSGWLVGQEMQREHGKRIVEALGHGVILGYPHQSPSLPGTTYPVVTTEGARRAPCWMGPLAQVLEIAASICGVPLSDLHTRRKTRKISRARRLFVVTARDELGRKLSEVARTLGITPAAAHYLAATAAKPIRMEAKALAAQVAHDFAEILNP